MVRKSDQIEKLITHKFMNLSACTSIVDICSYYTIDYAHKQSQTHQSFHLININNVR